MSYLVLLRFNSTQNADNFVLRYSAPLQATNAEITQGYTPAVSTGVGSPNPGANPATSTWVTIQVSNPADVPRGFQPQFIFDNSNNKVIYNSPTIDPNSLTLKQGLDTVFQNGVPIPDPTVTNYPYPIDPNLFPPVFDNPDLRKLLQRQSDQQEINRQLDQMLNPDQTQEDIVIPNVPPEPPLNYPKYPFKEYDPFTDPLNPFRQDMPDITTEPEPPVITPDPNIDPQMDITPLNKRVPDLPTPSNPIPKLEITPTSDSGVGGGVVGQQVVFVALEDSIITGIDTVTRNPQFWWSVDGITWNLALTTGENQAQNVTLRYGNGTWMAAVNWESIPGGNQNIDSTDFFYSSNGRNWTMVFNLGPSTTSSTFNNFDVANNRWDIAYALNNGPTQHFFKSSPFPVNSLFGDRVTGAAGAWAGVNPLPNGFKTVAVGNITALTFNYTLDLVTWVPTITFTTTGNVTIYWGKAGGQSFVA